MKEESLPVVQDKGWALWQKPLPEMYLKELFGFP
jgi:hypothetical protein